MGTTILAFIGAMTIFYIALCLEESIMEKLTSKGLIEQIYDYLKQFLSKR